MSAPKKLVRVDIKIALVGKQNVGKSSLLQRYTKNSFSSEGSGITIGAAFACTDLPSKDGEAIIRANIWDTAGMERFRSMIPMYTRDATVIFICFDYPKIEDIEENVRMAKRNNESCKIVLVQTKADMAPSFNPDHLQELNEELERYVRNTGYKFYKTSAKTGLKVKELFENEIEFGYTLKKSTVSFGGDDGGYGYASLGSFSDPPPPYTPKDTSSNSGGTTRAFDILSFGGYNPCCSIM